MKKLVHVFIQRPVQGTIIFTLKGSEEASSFSGIFKNTHASVLLVPNTEKGTYYEYIIYAQGYECRGLVTKEIEKGYCVVPEYNCRLDSIIIPEAIKEDSKPGNLVSISGSFNCNEDAPSLTLTSIKDSGEITPQSIDMSCLSEMMDSKISTIPQPDLSTYATKDIATTSTNGLLSSTDKIKLDGLNEYPRIKKIVHSNSNNVYNMYYPTPAPANFINLKTNQPTELMFNSYRGIKLSSSNGTQHGDYNRVSIAIGATPEDYAGDGLRTTRGILSVPEYEGATASTAGTDGLVPAATSAEKDMFLKGDGTWYDLNTDIANLKLRIENLEAKLNG